MDSKAIISEELGLTARAVMAVLDLFADGGTVPFIARYRKEATGGLDEVQIHAIEERSRYLSELDKRRETILATIEEQGKLGDDLRAQLEACRSKTELEDFYLPYRPKRKTRAEAARGRGLEPLAQRIVGQPPSGDPEQDARAFVNPEKDVPPPPWPERGTSWRR